MVIIIARMDLFSAFVHDEDDAKNKSISYQGLLLLLEF